MRWSFGALEAQEGGAISSKWLSDAMVICMSDLITKDEAALTSETPWKPRSERFWSLKPALKRWFRLVLEAQTGVFVI